MLAGDRVCQCHKCIKGGGCLVEILTDFDTLLSISFTIYITRARATVNTSLFSDVVVMATVSFTHWAFLKPTVLEMISHDLAQNIKPQRPLGNEKILTCVCVWHGRNAGGGVAGNRLAHFVVSLFWWDAQTHTWTVALTSDNKKLFSSSQSVASCRGLWGEGLGEGEMGNVVSQQRKTFPAARGMCADVCVLPLGIAHCTRLACCSKNVLFTHGLSIRVCVWACVACAVCYTYCALYSLTGGRCKPPVPLDRAAKAWWKNSVSFIHSR